MASPRYAMFGPALAAVVLAVTACAPSMTANSPSPAPAAAPTNSVATTPRLETLDQQIRLNPSDAQAYSNRGYVRALLGLKEPARADLRKAVELKPTAPMHNRAGWAYFNLGDYPEAVSHFEKSAELGGHEAHYDYYSLVLGYWGLGDMTQALKNYQLAVERDPRFGEYKTLNERTAEWTPLERRAIHEVYVLWSKAWKAQ